MDAFSRHFLAVALAAFSGCASPADQSGQPATPSGPRVEGAASAELFRVILPVAGLEEAARFYARVLETPGNRVSPGRHYFDCGGTILACFDPRGDGDDYDAVPLPEWIYFAVDGVAAARERCRVAGARFEPGEVGGAPAGEVARRPWGEVSFYARDPSGNGICFVERASVFTGRD